jgi:FMN phosphatase YigB (HAD superfamily)
VITTLIFDADGPLYHRGGKVKAQKLALLRDYGYEGEIDAFERLYDKEKFKGYVRGETPDEMFAVILAGLGLKPSAEEVAVFRGKFNLIQRQIMASPDAKETLNVLNDSGYKICVLTDSFYPAAEKWAWFNELGMDEYIDEIVSSYDIRTLKDSKAAYELCLSRLEAKSTQAVFIGHQQYEMNGAAQARIISVALLPIAIPKDITANHRIDSLSQLPSLLDHLNQEIVNPSH